MTAKGKPRCPPLTEEQMKRITKLWKADWSIKEIAKDLNRTEDVIKYNIKAHGLIPIEYR